MSYIYQHFSHPGDDKEADLRIQELINDYILRNNHDITNDLDDISDKVSDLVDDITEDIVFELSHRYDYSGQGAKEILEIKTRKYLLMKIVYMLNKLR